MARLSSADKRRKARELRAALVRVTRDGLGRFVDHTKLKACDTSDCDLEDLADAEDWRAKLREVDGTLDTIEALLVDDDPEAREAAAEIVHSFRLYLREDAERLERLEARKGALLMREAYEAELDDAGAGVEAWVEAQDVPDSMDVTGLDADQARRLALALLRMNPTTDGARRRGRVYVWRNGRRYVSPALRRANLYDPTLRELGLDADLWALVNEGRLRVRYLTPQAAA